MAATLLGIALDNLRSCLDGQDEAGPTDGELLECFVTRRDEAAFRVLLRRHGPMVLGVCRRVLRNEADAEDAFQATFLVLVRKAATIRPRGMVGNWLYGVAHTTALKARAMSIRRTAKEREAAARSKPGASAESAERLSELLDLELKLLPEKYRAAIVLCDLEGKSIKEAARQLDCPQGTVSTRLARGRRLLARRLARHELTLSAGALAALLSGRAALAGVPPRLATLTVEAGTLLAAGQTPIAGVVSARVAALTDGVLKTMLLTKLKIAVVVLSAVVLAAAVLVQSLPAQPPNADTPTQTRPARAEKRSPEVDAVQSRRDRTYSVRAVIRVMPPYNLKAMNDDYQDVRVLKETREYAELEVVAYPVNFNADAIKGNPNWKKDYAGMTEYLAPGVTTNWDEPMRKDLLRELAQDGIDPEKLTDKEVVEQVSRWLFKRSKHRNMFCTFYVGFRDGKPEVLPGLEKKFDSDKGDPKWTVKEQFEHELFGKEMFARKTYGTCTSAAVYQTTVLRALGIPTRMILCIPLADGSDSAQVEMVDKGLTNHRVRRDACMGALSGGTSFASHTFLEVFVGGRWRRLNSTTLGQNILARSFLGLMIKVHEFKDLSDANLAATWGTRFAKGQRDELFPHSNPYRLLEVSDHFGKYAKVDNPPADREHKHATLGKVYWQEAKDAPAEIRGLNWWKEPGSGRFFVHAEEWFENAGDHLQYKLFMMRSDRKFVLRTKGQPDVSCQISGNFVSGGPQKLCELEILIPPAEYDKMSRGVAYTLHPINGKQRYEWKVREGLKLTRE